MTPKSKNQGIQSLISRFESPENTPASKPGRRKSLARKFIFSPQPDVSQYITKTSIDEIKVTSPKTEHASSFLQVSNRSSKLIELEESIKKRRLQRLSQITDNRSTVYDATSFVTANSGPNHNEGLYNENIPGDQFFTARSSAMRTPEPSGDFSADSPETNAAGSENELPLPNIDMRLPKSPTGRLRAAIPHEDADGVDTISVSSFANSLSSQLAQEHQEHHRQQRYVPLELENVDACISEKMATLFPNREQDNCENVPTKDIISVPSVDGRYCYLRLDQQYDDQLTSKGGSPNGRPCSQSTTTEATGTPIGPPAGSPVEEHSPRFHSPMSCPSTEGMGATGEALTPKEKNTAECKNLDERDRPNDANRTLEKAILLQKEVTVGLADAPHLEPAGEGYVTAVGEQTQEKNAPKVVEDIMMGFPQGLDKHWHNHEVAREYKIITTPTQFTVTYKTDSHTVSPTSNAIDSSPESHPQSIDRSPDYKSTMSVESANSTPNAFSYMSTPSTVPNDVFDTISQEESMCGTPLEEHFNVRSSLNYTLNHRIIPEEGERDPLLSPLMFDEKKHRRRSTKDYEEFSRKYKQKFMDNIKNDDMKEQREPRLLVRIEDTIKDDDDDHLKVPIGRKQSQLSSRHKADEHRTLKQKITYELKKAPSLKFGHKPKSASAPATPRLTAPIPQFNSPQLSPAIRNSSTFRHLELIPNSDFASKYIPSRPAPLPKSLSPKGKKLTAIEKPLPCHPLPDINWYQIENFTDDKNQTQFLNMFEDYVTTAFDGF